MFLSLEKRLEYTSKGGSSICQVFHDNIHICRESIYLGTDEGRKHPLLFSLCVERTGQRPQGSSPELSVMDSPGRWFPSRAACPGVRAGSGVQAPDPHSAPPLCAPRLCGIGQASYWPSACGSKPRRGSPPCDTHWGVWAEVGPRRVRAEGCLQLRSRLCVAAAGRPACTHGRPRLLPACQMGSIFRARPQPHLALWNLEFSKSPIAAVTEVFSTLLSVYPKPRERSRAQTFGEPPAYKWRY